MPTPRLRISSWTRSNNLEFVASLVAKDQTICDRSEFLNPSTPLKLSSLSMILKSCLPPFLALLNAQSIWKTSRLSKLAVPRLRISSSTLSNKVSEFNSFFAKDHTNRARSLLPITEKSLDKISSKKISNSSTAQPSELANNINIAASNWPSKIETLNWPSRMDSCNMEDISVAFKSRFMHPLTIWLIFALPKVSISRERIALSQIWTNSWSFSSRFPKDHITLARPLGWHLSMSLEILSSNSRYTLFDPCLDLPFSCSKTRLWFPSLPVILAML